jgi:antitoxin MazE
MRSEIKRWGNSAAVRIPSQFLHEAKLEVHSRISMKVEDNRIVIEALQERSARGLALPFTEAQLLTDLDPHTAHADELPAALLDRELGN